MTLVVNKYDLESRDPVSSEFAFETFSKAGFKPISAICEIVDNSIEANADEIIIKFEWRPKKSPQSYQRVEKFVFIDNGDGMDERRIYDYFVATESDKRDNPQGIGRFGVGAYMAAISQANTSEVYSKIKGGKWLYTNLIKGGKIPKPIPKDPPKEYIKYEQGTIVIWSDTYSKFNENDIIGEAGENLIFELGRIYRKFMTKEKVVGTEKGSKIIKNKKIIKIKIDTGLGTILDVIPYDPLFQTYNQKLDDVEKPKMVSQRVPLRNLEYTGSMVVTYSIFPESWWLPHHRPGLEPVNTQERKISARDEGISLVREGRELYFGSFPGGPIRIIGLTETKRKSPHFEDVDRWTGIEVSFDRDSDEIFGVEFNKTRITMEKYARDMISKTISPTIVERRNFFNSTRKEHEEASGKSGTKSGKKATEAIHGAITKPKYTSEQQKRLRKFAERFKDNLESTEDVYQDLLNGYHVSLGYKLDPNGPFVSFGYEADSVLVKYNMEHPFMKKFFEMLEKIGLKLGAEPEKANSLPEIQTLRALLDMLMASFGFTKTTFPDVTKSQDIESTINQLVSNWGNLANKLAKAELD